MFYKNVVVLTPPQNIFKMFPHISGVENKYFPKANVEILKIIIEAVLFNLYGWLCIIINHINPFVNLWKYYQIDVKNLIHYIIKRNYSYTREACENHWAGGTWFLYYLLIRFSIFYIFITYTLCGTAPSNRGNLGPVPAPVARGCHGPLKHSFLPNLGRYQTRTRRAME